MSEEIIHIHAPNGVHDPSWKNFRVKVQPSDTIKDVYSKFKEIFASGYHSEGAWFTETKKGQKLDDNFPVRDLKRTEDGEIKLFSYGASDGLVRLSRKQMKEFDDKKRQREIDSLKDELNEIRSKQIKLQNNHSNLVWILVGGITAIFISLATVHLLTKK
jgi:hypothetical protein